MLAIVFWYSLKGPSMKPGTWNIPEHPGTFRNNAEQEKKINKNKGKIRKSVYIY